ncbi:MAG: helix-turn-helix domain-containing protein [Actinomycetota bacterium]|nr:helix-turn-helix domain-containing protein [Actinomycetota bacterium]
MTSDPVPSGSAAISDHDWLTPKDICNLLHIPEQTFYQWRVKHQGFRAYRISRHLRISRRDYELWLFSRLAS